MQVLITARHGHLADGTKEKITADIARSRLMRPFEARHCPFASQTVSPSGNRGVTLFCRNFCHWPSLITPTGLVRPKYIVVLVKGVPPTPHDDDEGCCARVGVSALLAR